MSVTVVVADDVHHRSRGSGGFYFDHTSSPYVSPSFMLFTCVCRMYIYIYMYTHVYNLL